MRYCQASRDGAASMSSVGGITVVAIMPLLAKIGSLKASCAEAMNSGASVQIAEELADMKNACEEAPNFCSQTQ